MAQSLYQEKLIKHPHLFRWMARLEGKAGHLKAGEYIINPDMTAQQILNKIARGEYVSYALTLPEGWTLGKIRVAIEVQPNLKQTLGVISNEDIADEFKSIHKNPEGLFFPETYVFSWGVSDRDILKLAYQKMESVLNQLWEGRAPGLPYHSSYEALIVASLIENEAKREGEKPLIAAVILQRLKIGMPLQIDSTIIYAMGDKYQGKITKADLAIKSPYNSYLYTGLPPTPISSPGLASLKAALHPALSNDLYFVAKGDGSHAFSTDLRSHNNAVKRYILQKKQLINHSMFLF